MGISLFLILGLGLAIFVATFAVTSQLQNSGRRPPRDDFAPRDDQQLRQRRDRTRVQPVENQLPRATTPHREPTLALAEIEAELRSLLANGQKIEALKRVRATSGWGLKAAKQYIDYLTTGNADFAIPAPGVALAEIDDKLHWLLAHNRKIEAIKQVRMATGWGLKESKAYIDRLESQRD